LFPALSEEERDGEAKLQRLFWDMRAAGPETAEPSSAWTGEGARPHMSYL